MTPTFLPDRLRPRPVRRRRRRVAAPVALVAGLAVLPLWRIDSVEVRPCRGVPNQVVEALGDLEGEPVWAVDLDDVRRRLEVWPAVAGVEVRLELPDRLLVRMRPHRIAGSARVGRGWHGVTLDGGWAGPLPGPVAPIVEGRADGVDDRRRALTVARRLETATGRAVLEARAITPSDLEVHLAATAHDPLGLVARVAPRETAAERWWSGLVASGQTPSRWVDLRWDDRLVVGGPA